jgi:hypothetical protein
MYTIEPTRKRKMIIRKVVAITASLSVAVTVAVLGVVFAQPASALAGDTHFFMGTRADVFDAVQPSGGTFRAVDRISRTTGQFDGNMPPRISAVAVGNQVHLLAVANGGLLHSIRGSDGTWSAFTSVPLNGVSIIFKVVAVNVGGQLHAVLHSGSHVYHAARSSRGVWTPFIDIESQAGGLGDFFTSITDVTAAGTIFGRMELVLSTEGALHHTTRRSNGAWDGWDNVTNQTGNPGHRFQSSSLTLAPIGNDVHLVTIGVGAPYHAVRAPNGTWTRFGNVYGQTGNPTGGFIQGLSTTALSGGRLLVAMHTIATSTLPDLLLYAIRQADGTWTSFQSFPGPTDNARVWSFAVASE